MNLDDADTPMATAQPSFIGKYRYTIAEPIAIIDLLIVIYFIYFCPQMHTYCQFGAISLLSGVSSKAQTVQYTLADFGTPVDNRGGTCAPTATANSFQFLKRRYPNIYGGTNLIRGNDPAETRNEFAGGWFPPNCGGRRDGMEFGNPAFGTEGASDKDWWQVKQQWIADFAPGTTTFAGMVDNSNAPNWVGGSKLKVGLIQLTICVRQFCS